MDENNEPQVAAPDTTAPEPLAASEAAPAPAGKPKKRRAKKPKKPHLVRKSFGLVLAVLFAVVVFALAAVTGSGMVGQLVVRFLGTPSEGVSSEVMTETDDATKAAADQVESEGAVLLANDGTLPLSSDTKKVNVFGWASIDWQGGGSGSGGVGSVDVDFIEALNAAGIETNTELTKMYEDFEAAGQRPRALSSKPEESSVLYEPSVSNSTYYSESLLANAKEYSDTAIVVLGRYGGESNDWPLKQYKVTEKGGDVVVDDTRTALDLSAEEEELLAYVGANYENVVVVINAANAMGLGSLETTDGVDAVLLAGYTGQYSAEALPAILWGETNPSGRTVDTFAYAFDSAPSYANASENVGAYTDADGLYPADGTEIGNFSKTEPYTQVSYVDYSEGIYVGYKWYETADAEGYWANVSNEYGDGYDGVVQYPFGYGLSYTSFDWEVVDAPADGSALGDSTSITVRVTNTGSVAGKDVVELYYSAPYTAGGIEKSSVVLGDYAKTKLLEPGESQEITLTVSTRDMSSYDCYDANGNGFAGYELDPGSYTLSLRHNAHEVDDAAGATVTLSLGENLQYATDATTGAEVTNRFTGEDAVDGVSLDGSTTGEAISQLSRADFAGTYPAVASTRKMTSDVAALNLYTTEDAQNTWSERDAAGAIMPTTGADNGLAIEENGIITELGRELGSDASSSKWDDLLDQLTVEEMENTVLNCYSGTGAIASVGKDNEAKDADGPSQIGGFVPINPGTGFPCAVVIAQTWNVELANQMGLLEGQQAAQRGYSGWYAPACNIHRSPFDGRNFEYYSEDSLLSGRMCGNVVAGAKDAGIYCYVKHFICNDGESYVYRDSVYTWMSEQTLRETYLEPFRILIEEYGGTALMTSYNRIGAVWSGGSEALITDILRAEWGFEGSVITDFSDHPVYMNGNQELAVGGDLWMNLMGGSLVSEPESASYVSALRSATKHVLYTYLNARVTNENYVATSGNANAARPASSALSTPVPAVMTVLRVVAVALLALTVWRLVVGIKLKRSIKRGEA
jgi:beta-glucosidase